MKRRLPQRVLARVSAAVSSVVALMIIAGGSAAPQAPMAAFKPAALAAASGLSSADNSTLFMPAALRNFPAPTVFGVTIEPMGNLGALGPVAAPHNWTRGPYIEWDKVETAPGVRNWAAVGSLDAQLVSAANGGLQLVLAVARTPAWAQQTAGLICGPIRNDQLGAFAAFMYDAVARYSRPPYNITYWEIWNEPDVDLDGTGLPPDNPFGCWGDADDPYYGGRAYGEMLAQVYPRMKAANPYIQVLIGGLLLDCDPAQPPPGKTCQSSRFLEGILLGGGTQVFDGVSFHAYDYYGLALGAYSNSNWNTTWNTGGPAMVGKAAFLRGVLAQYGANGKYLMNTEAALLCGVNCDATFEATKAMYLVQSYVLAQSDQYRANIWYSLLGWRSSGLVTSNLTPLPAHTAFSVAAAKLRGMNPRGAVGAPAGVAAYEFVDGGQRLWVVWSRDGASHALALPSTPSAVTDIYGGPLTIAGTITVGVEPRYVEWVP